MPSRSFSKASAADLAAALEARGLTFHIKAGTATYQAVLQDRATYERKKAQRTNSTASLESNSSTDSNYSN